MLPQNQETLAKILKALGGESWPGVVLCKTFKSSNKNEIFVSINFQTSSGTDSEDNLKNKMFKNFENILRYK